MIDRSEVSRALAKAIAFKQCGQDEKAALWAARLVILLEAGEILATADYMDARESMRVDA